MLTGSGGLASREARLRAWRFVAMHARSMVLRAGARRHTSKLTRIDIQLTEVPTSLRIGGLAWPPIRIVAG